MDAVAVNERISSLYTKALGILESAVKPECPCPEAARVEAAGILLKHLCEVAAGVVHK